MFLFCLSVCLFLFFCFFSIFVKVSCTDKFPRLKKKDFPNTKYISKHTQKKEKKKTHNTSKHNILKIEPCYAAAIVRQPSVGHVFFSSFFLGQSSFLFFLFLTDFFFFFFFYVFCILHFDENVLNCILKYLSNIS
jgi:hypothetical protein